MYCHGLWVSTLSFELIRQEWWVVRPFFAHPIFPITAKCSLGNIFVLGFFSVNTQSPWLCKLCIWRRRTHTDEDALGLKSKTRGMRKAGGYTQAEDFLIRDLVEEMGPQFAEIAKLLQGRAASDYFVSPHWALHVGEARKFENCIQIAKQRSCFIQRQIRSKLVSLIRILLVNFRRHRTVHTHCLRLGIVLFLIHSNVTD